MRLITVNICDDCGLECMVEEVTKRYPHPELDSGFTVEEVTYLQSCCCGAPVSDRRYLINNGERIEIA